MKNKQLSIYSVPIISTYCKKKKIIIQIYIHIYILINIKIHSLILYKL